MLVLSRQKDESIVIGDDVEVTIVDVRGDKVRLGITAPKNIPVHRREIYEAIQREKEAQRQSEQAPAEQPAGGSEQSPQAEPEKQP
ncbi:MAG: carbon storage regulator CsrA [Phycisphaerales bacterium]|nr:MAG: carbon storage regulator CsrA [Phycisphaerales bacterium]